DPTVDMDPRVPPPPSGEDIPDAIAAAPAISGDSPRLGVVYVGRNPSSAAHDQNWAVQLNQESMAGLKAFGLVCGDMIAREKVGLETVKSLAQSFTIPSSREARVDSLQSLLYKMVAGARTTPPLDSLNPSWIYLLTLNVRLKLHIQIP